MKSKHQNNIRKNVYMWEAAKSNLFTSEKTNFERDGIDEGARVDCGWFFSVLFLLYFSISHTKLRRLWADLFAFHFFLLLFYIPLFHPLSCEYLSLETAAREEIQILHKSTSSNIHAFRAWWSFEVRNKTRSTFVSLLSCALAKNLIQKTEDSTMFIAQWHRRLITHACAPKNNSSIA